MKTLKDIFILIITYFIFFLLIELFSRSLVFFITKNKIIYSYGFNNTIFFKINDLSEFDLVLYSSSSKKLNKTKKNYNKSERIVIWTFGGSTTKGDEPKCGHYTSSWPDELSNLNKSIIVKNFGKRGSSTNHVINILYNQNFKEKPDIILWANKSNEEFNYTSINKNFFLDRIHLTMRLNFVSYFLVHDIMERISFKIFGYQEPYYIKDRIEEELIKNYQESIKIYEKNTISAINLARNFDIDFHIISLFGKFNFDTKKIFHIDFYDHWFTSAEKLSKEYGVFYFKTEDEALNTLANTKEGELFCDTVHQTLKGNILTASIINDYLMKIYNFKNK